MAFVEEHLMVDAIVTMHVTSWETVVPTRLMSVARRNLLPDPVQVSFLVLLIYYNFSVVDPWGAIDERPLGPISSIIMQLPAKNPQNDVVNVYHIAVK